MALSLKNKLFAGFGLVIGISMITGGVIIHEARIIEERSTFVLEESVPTMLNVSTLRGSIHNALSMHRGYMILGLEELGGERLKAWDSINGAMDELKVISSDWPADQVELVSELDDVLVQFRTAQDEIAAVSHTPEDRPADELFFHHALPKSEQVVKALEHILDLEHDEETTPERKVLVEHVAAAEAHLLKASSAVSAFLVTGLEEDEAYVNKCVNLCSESVERLKTDIDLFTPEQKKSFDDYLTYRGEFLDLATESIAIRKSDNWCVSQNICLNTVTPLAGKADQIAHEIVEKQAKSQMAAGANAREQLAHAVAALPVIVVIASIVSVLFGGVIAWFLARNIGLIIREVASRAHAIASRDLTIEPLEVKTKDDLGKLSMSVNEMLHSLREILTDVNDSSNAVAQMSDQIMNSSTEVASGMEMQMVEIQQISAAATQMAASVGEVAGSSRNASETATESAETAREGGNVVSEVVMRMDEIRNSVEASAESVSELGHQSEQIGEIISVINDIADQTNLLALNAAIEAARAGEHGRGFAVVADEVRKLAERTQVATEEVSTTISTIQVETKAAVDRMNAGTEVVAQGVELTQNAGKSLNEIVSGAGMVTSQVQSIAAAAEEQAAASEEISRGITEISNVVRNSKASTDESTAMANELASRAQGLKEIVGKFSI